MGYRVITASKLVNSSVPGMGVRIVNVRTINLMPLDEANTVFKLALCACPFDDALAPHFDAGFVRCFHSSLAMHHLQSLRVKLYTSWLCQVYCGYVDLGTLQRV